MGKTKLEIRDELFYINGKLVYSEIEGSSPDVHGLLMNARFIQGVFDDQADRTKFNRFGSTFDPDKNTQDLIAALPEWYNYGLRAFTVGFQGGGPCFTINTNTIENNPFGPDGNSLDIHYADRMDRLLKAADEQGMIAIVSFLYPNQCSQLMGGRAVLNAVRTASRFLKDGGYMNVIIEICNEHNQPSSHSHSLIQTAEGIIALMEIARTESGGMPVGCSGSGSYINEEICKESDVILVHGNGCTRQTYYNKIKTIRSWSLNKPILCNEDSQALGQLGVAFQTRTSWGYYNNMTKQEPPVNWGITQGEDQFFSQRMAEGIGIKVPPIPEEDRYYLQGLEENMEYEGQRWIRLASLYPETIDRVDFYLNDAMVFTCYVEPFLVNFITNWKQKPWFVTKEDKEWKAVIYLKNGEVIETTHNAK